MAAIERGNVVGNSDVLSPTDKVPEATLEVMRKMQNMKYQETLYGLLNKQYEMAKLDAAREAAIIQVVDKALVPEKESEPKRGLIVLLATIMALFIGIVLAFIKESAERAKQDPEQVERMKLLRRYLRG